MSKALDFLTKDLQKELNSVFETEATIEQIVSLWDNRVIEIKTQDAEIKAHNYTPNEYREGSGDIGVYRAPAWEQMQFIKLLENGHARTKDFYQGVISGILLKHKQVGGDGWVHEYQIPIAYCFSQLKKLAETQK
jgi:hypothetical protein